MGPMVPNSNLSQHGPGPGANFLPPQLRVRPPMMAVPTGSLQPPPSLPANLTATDTTLQSGPVKYSDSQHEQPKSAVIEAPKIIYSAKPVLNKPTKRAAEPEPVKVQVPQPEVRKHEVPPAVDYNPPIAAPKPTSEPTTSSFDSQPPTKKGKKAKERRFIRTAANDVWEDTSLAEWDPSK